MFKKKTARLVDGLLDTHVGVRDNALEESLRLARRGDNRAVNALKEAIRLKSRTGSTSHLEVIPGMPIVPSSSVSSRIVSLVEESALLDNPRHSEELAAGFLLAPGTRRDSGEIDRLGAKIQAVGGDKEYHSFQLLIAYLTASVDLLNAGG
ncbi:MAG: hypothetical protein ABII79_06520 [bacterium]